ncbi:MAG: ABC transporter ATP-binding protein [Phycisphaerales bacterium]|nr:ABC transporter ATP-binding protein [Phycisphaerales bacterium]
MASISIQGLTKTFGDGLIAVNNLDLEIEDGSFVVFVGPSGCGKSTTLRMIAGLESISQGTIEIGGRVVNKVAPKDRDIAMVFQNYALYPHLSVEDNMGFSLRMNKMPKDERHERVKEAAVMLGLENILNKKPGQLSGGQRQRVALGRAVVRKPAVFLFDEPLSNLDPDRRAATRAEIRRIQKELGTTTVYVTHDHEEAMALGDKIVIMNDGFLQQAGPAEEIYESPCNQFVGTFLGTPKMNIIPATLHTNDSTPSAEISVDGQPITIPLNPSQIPSDASDSATVSIGIRPHQVVPATDQADQVQIKGTIIDLEQLGFAIDVHIRFGEHTIMARISGQHKYTIGQEVHFSFDPSALHLFTK